MTVGLQKRLLMVRFIRTQQSKDMLEDYLDKLQFRIKLLLGLAVVLVLVLVFFIYKDYVISEKLEKLQKEMEQIDAEIKKIDLANAKIDGKVESYKDNFSAVERNINNNNIKIDRLIKDGKDKKDNFVSYNANMWERYFTDRYEERRAKEHGKN